MTPHVLKRAVVVAASFAAIGASPVEAQMKSWGPWSYTVYGTGEYDTNEVGLALGGVSFAPSQLGWSPMFGVQGHWLRYPAAVGGNVTLTGVQPYLGVQNNYGVGLIGVRAGYQFESSKAVVAAPVAVSTGDGFVVTGQLEHWGAPEAVVGGQALATYNFGSETFWGRGRLDVPITQLNPGAIRIGAEVAYLSAAGTPGFSTTSVGPVLLWQTGRGVNLGFAAGKRFGDSDATYFRIDFALFPQQR